MDKKIQVKTVGYRLVEFLGEGLNSDVYRAIKDDAGYGVRFEVALKILKSERSVAIWRNEFERLCAVQSRHCVRLLGWEIVNEKPTLVLEYVEGVTLAQLIGSARLAKSEIEDLLFQVMTGLRDLAEVGLFHGDLNLHNIMIDRSGLVKLVDFGIFDKGGELMTTPRFAAPEVLAGHRPSHQTDIYSLSAIGEELCRCSQISMALDVKSLRARPGAHNRLGQKVDKILKNREQQLGFTKKIMRVHKYCRSRASLTRVAVVFLLLSISGFSRGDQYVQNYLAGATISVRSQRWLRVSLDNAEKGFSPLDIRVAPNKKIKIHWSGAGGQGQTSLTLVSGQHIVLDDEFFRRHSFRDHSRPD